MYRLAEERITSGVRDLSSNSSLQGANEKVFHVVQVMSVAVELMVWAVPTQQGDAGKGSSSPGPSPILAASPSPSPMLVQCCIMCVSLLLLRMLGVDFHSF